MRGALVGDGELVVADASGGETRLPIGPEVSIAASLAADPWSPDGSRLLLEQAGPLGSGLSRLLVYDLAARAIVGNVVVATGWPRPLAAWSSDGARLAVRDPATGVLRVLDPDGTVRATLPADPVEPSPDLAHAVTGTVGRTWLVDVASGARTELPVGDFRGATWSRDGSHVLLEPAGPPNDPSWSVATVDGAVVEVPEPAGAARAWGAALAPDGSALAYRTPDELVVVSTRPPFADLLRVRVPGGSATPAWSPDGRTIAFLGLTVEPCLPGVQALDLATGTVASLTNDCVVAGTEGDDRIRVVSPAIVQALGGDDEVVIEPSTSGLPSSSVVDAGPGNDRVVSTGPLVETVDAGPGDDVVLAGGGADVVRGGPGRDRVDGGRGRDTVAGGADDDALRGGPDVVDDADADRLDGGLGDDVLLGGARGDLLLGGPGRDILVGGAGADVLVGGRDADDLRARDRELDCVAGLEPADGVRRDPGLDVDIGGPPVRSALDDCLALARRARRAA